MQAPLPQVVTSQYSPSTPSAHGWLRPGSVGLSSETKLQSSSRPLHSSAGKVHAPSGLQSLPVVVAGFGQWYSQPVVVIGPAVGLWR